METKEKLNNYGKTQSKLDAMHETFKQQKSNKICSGNEKSERPSRTSSILNHCTSTVNVDTKMKSFDDFAPHLRQVVNKTTRNELGSLRNSRSNISVHFKDIFESKLQTEQKKMPTNLRSPAVAAIRVEQKEFVEDTKLQFDDLCRKTEEKIKSIRRQQITSQNNGSMLSKDIPRVFSP